MRCPFCANTDTQVKDSRPTDEHTAIRRRRFCPECAGRFTTFERVQLRELNVIKKNGRKTPFNREKLLLSLTIALRKRDIEDDRIERMVSSIVRRLESRGESDVPSETIGQMVMEGLKALDEVAYIRYASVYKDFHEAKEFGEIINNLSDDDD